MAINLSSLSSAVTKATALSNLVLVTPQNVVGYQPQNPLNADGSESTAQQPPTLMFHYEGEQTVTLESDITDHYVEDNTPIQDQIALKPEIITTRGFIGELNNVPPPGLALLKAAADRLTVIGAYAPQVSETALIAYNTAFLVYQTAKNAANSAVSAWSSIGNLFTGQSGQTVIGSDGISNVGSVQNKQQIAFQQFYGYWRNRVLFTIQTPWAVFQNMAIQRVKPIQTDETEVITEFEVTFKMIRFAQTVISGSFGITALDGRAASQGAPLTNLGTSSPVPGPSLSSGLSSMGLA